jgi:hypothetical protein
MARFGVQYGDEHAKAGFSAHLAGVTLFPIQAVESMFVFCVVVWGTGLMLNTYPEGSAFTFYVLIYGAGRFYFEFGRGDGERPSLWGFSEAQWTSLLLVIAVICAEGVDILPISLWHWMALLLLGVSIIFIATWRRLDHWETYELLHPQHVWEFVAILNHLDVPRQSSGLHLNHSVRAIHVGQTSLGCRLSVGETMETNRPIKHCTLSKADGSLSIKTARLQARLIARLVAHRGVYTIVKGSPGASRMR